MPVKPRRELTEKTKSDEKEVREVFFKYFSTLGGYCFGQELQYKSPPWHADFFTKWGPDDYRRQAWAAVKSELKKVFSDELFKILDDHFGDKGTAQTFLRGFTTEQKYNFCDMILGCSRSTDLMRELAANSLQYRPED